MYVLYMELKKQHNHTQRLQQNPDTKRERWAHGYNLNFGSFSFLEWLLKNGRVFLVRHLFCFTGGRKRRMYTINKLKKESVKLTTGNIKSWKMTSNCLSCYSTRLEFHKEQLCKAQQLWDPCCKFNCTPFPEEAKENTPLGNFLKGTLHSGLERTSVSISRSVSKRREQWKVTFQGQSKYFCKLRS